MSFPYFFFFFKFDAGKEEIRFTWLTHGFESSSAHPDIPSIYFFSQNGVLVEEISGCSKIDIGRRL